MRVSYPELFSSGNFRGRKFILVGESCNNPFFSRIILIIYYMCLCVIICLCVYFIWVISYNFKK